MTALAIENVLFYCCAGRQDQGEAGRRVPWSRVSCADLLAIAARDAVVLVNQTTSIWIHACCTAHA
jgi:hypothetical protein